MWMLPEPEGVISDHRPTPWPGPRAARAPRPAAPGAHTHPRHPWAADAPPAPRSAVRHARGNLMLPDSPSRTKRIDLARDVNDAVTGNCRTPWRGEVCAKAGLRLRPGRTVRRCQRGPCPQADLSAPGSPAPHPAVRTRTQRSRFSGPNGHTTSCGSPAARRTKRLRAKSPRETAFGRELPARRQALKAAFGAERCTRAAFQKVRASLFLFWVAV